MLLRSITVVLVTVLAVGARGGGRVLYRSPGGGWSVTKIVEGNWAADGFDKIGHYETAKFSAPAYAYIKETNPWWWWGLALRIESGTVTRWDPASTSITLVTVSDGDTILLDSIEWMLCTDTVWRKQRGWISHGIDKRFPGLDVRWDRSRSRAPRANWCRPVMENTCCFAVPSVSSSSIVDGAFHSQRQRK